MYFRVMLAENSDKNCVNPTFFHMCETSIPTTQSHRRPTRGNNGCLLSPDYIRSASKNKFVHQIQSIERQEIYHVHVLANLTDIYIIAICVTVGDCLDVDCLYICLFVCYLLPDNLRYRNMNGTKMSQIVRGMPLMVTKNCQKSQNLPIAMEQSMARRAGQRVVTSLSHFLAESGNLEHMNIFGRNRAECGPNIQENYSFQT